MKTISYAGQWGKRESKYSWLDDNDIKTTQWQPITPISEYYYFKPTDDRFLAAYETYPKITDIFPVNSVGIVTARDNLTIGWTNEEVWQTVLNFSKLDPELARQTYDLGLDTRDWKVELAQRDLREGGIDRSNLTPVLYRPFDVRYTYYTGNSRGFICMPRKEVMKHMSKGFICRPRKEVMKHMLQIGNLGLCVDRQWGSVGSASYDVVFISETITDFNLFRRGGAVIFPAYLYQNNSLFHANEETKKSNIKPEILEHLSVVFKKQISTEDVLYYIYAVLHSDRYKTKYAEFLKRDFPRIPFTVDVGIFNQLASYGQRLVELHLLKSPELNIPISRFQGNGDCKVEKLKYDGSFRRVHINKSQYFEGVSEYVWKYQIGGYQVCDKWLKDRKGRALSSDEIQNYCKIVTAIQKTIELQKEIDTAYDDLEACLL